LLRRHHASAYIVTIPLRAVRTVTLPIEEVLPPLRAALSAHGAAVLQAPPGAGKTTGVPLALLTEPWLAGRSILMLEPRRLAARAASARMADLLGEAVGETVGFQIRFEKKVTSHTRIEVLTEGILTRRLQSDPALEGVGLVIFDEYHERHLHGDLALALCLDSRRILRPDLKVLIMSATLDAQAAAKHLGNAPVITSAGRSFPVEIHYVAQIPNESIPNAVHKGIVRALTDTAGDVLAFLPGAFEIRKTQELLQSTVGGRAEIFPLYGDLPWEAQQQALRPRNNGPRKIILATPIAETSLTIEGIDSVIDSGYVRVPQFDPNTGLTRLATMRVSRASADQRAGRAGRLRPGSCYRLWSEATHQGLIAQAIPEIKTADLTPLALELSLWGAHDANALSWVDPPPQAALAQARELLFELDALDAEGRITAVGRDLARLALHPRLAHMLYEARRIGAAALGCDIAALISERDILMGNARRGSDFGERIDALAAFRSSGRADAQAHQADPAACARVEQAARQWRRLLNLSDGAHASFDAETAGVLLAMAYPDRVAKQRAPGAAQYVLASGRGARLPERQARRDNEYIVAASLDLGEREGMIYLASPISLEAIRTHLARRIEVRNSIYWDASSESVVVRREERLGEMLLAATPLSDAESSQVRAAAVDGIRRLGVETLPWTAATRTWQGRVLSLRAWFPDENWPDVSDRALADSLEHWLEPYLDGMTRREQFNRIDLTGALEAMLDARQRHRLQEGAPTHVTVPSGSQVRLDYIPGQAPVLAVKLQEMFGLADTPRVAWGKIPVMLHLLSPARRPIQVTQDLSGFWERTYRDVKKELKGRYPKHPWPDDPRHAVATARTRRSNRKRG
jgi:ATP-dependent helicase HrpB